MSVANLPEGLKSIAPYLQRAAQLQDREPIVAYYSNYYAAKLAIQKASKEPTHRAFIEELLNVLEKQRKDIGENEAISSDLVGYAHIENFALKIFGKADDEDRAGQASQKTAKNFVAAANFLDLLRVFGDIDSEVEEKIKYAKWRAAEIIKAIRDGRQPAPPPGASNPSELDQLNDASMTGLQATNVMGGDGAGVGPGIDRTADSATFSPSAAAQLTMPPTQPMVDGANPFPTISNFPSPPLGSFANNINSNTFNGATNDSNINWNQATISPNMSQGQPTFYNTTGTPPVHQPQHPQHPQHPQQPQQPQQPPSAYSSPAVSSPAPTSTHMPVASNPTMPPASSPYDYGNNAFANSNPYQPPALPSPAPAPAPAPVQTPYAQPGFNSPSAPYHQQQPQQPPTPQMPYMPAPMVMDPAINNQVQKHCKWTVSALTYDDIPTAIDNLEKALALLRPFHNK